MLIGSSIAITQVGHLSLGAYGDAGWDDSEFRELLNTVKRLQDEHGEVHGILNFAPLRGPTWRQRKMVVSEFGETLHIERIRRVATLADSTLSRHAVTAYSWMLSRPAFKAWSSSHWRLALHWLAEAVEFDMQEAALSLENMVSVILPRQMTLFSAGERVR